MDDLEQLIEDFSFFDDWEERYRYLIDMGRALPQMDDSLKNEETLVRGCTSKVWMLPDIQDGVFTFQADSDAHIVRGLIAVLMKVYQGRKVSELAGIDIGDAFHRIGLDTHLSPNRRNGFFSMVDRIKACA